MSVETDVGAAAPATDAAVSTDTAAAATTTVTEATEPAKSWDDDLKAVWEKHNPLRSTDGKFAPREPAATEPVEPEATEATETPADQPATETTETAKAPSIDPPQSWSAEARALWSTVPPAAQAIIAKREAEAHQAITRSGELLKSAETKAKEYEPLGHLIQDFQQEFAKRNVQPVQGIHMLLNAQRALDQNPLAGLVQIGLTYGIDLRPFFTGQPQQQAEGQQASPDHAIALHPAVVGLSSKVAQLESFLTEQQRKEHQAQQARTQAEHAALSQEIAGFSKDKPHFEAVRQHMAALVQSGAASTLQDAYEQATWAIPSVREQILSDQRKTEEEKRRAEQAKKATEAKKAASVNLKSSTSVGTTPKTMDDTLQEIARRAYG